MKDGFGGVIIIGFIGLKSKMYGIDGKEHNTAKGVNIATELIILKTFYLIKKLLNIK